MMFLFMIQLAHVKKNKKINQIGNNADGIMASMGGNSIWFEPWGHKINKYFLGGRPSLVKKRAGEGKYYLT